MYNIYANTEAKIITITAIESEELGVLVGRSDRLPENKNFLAHSVARAHGIESEGFTVNFIP